VFNEEIWLVSRRLYSFEVALSICVCGMEVDGLYKSHGVYN
jgi:hypothetical protein